MTLFRPVHWVRTHSFTSSLYWSARSWLWNHPITSDYAVWDQGDPSEWEEWNKERARILRIWKFLEPYFAERGYTLYVQKDLTDVFALQYPASKMIETRHLSYPYAQYHCKNEADLRFFPDSPRVWPARDKDGRDVVIKAISGAVPNNELKALQLLHSEPLCNDPRNRTIPVIEFIEYNQQTFVVMPRWCVAIECDFVTVGEIIGYARAIFEAVAFLHENNIAHGDLLAQNMCMDVILPKPRNNHDYYTGLHGPERKYVLIDFETAQIHRGSGPCSPEFERSRKRDIYFLAWSLLPNLRCIENVIPPIVDLLDSMMENDSSVTASAALSRFEEVCASLTKADLNLPVAAYLWSDGHLQYREGPPANQ
ncbi:hypothetical protein Agabi119p4_7976 [Agaricus bisporus var. burnettii]|uniref:Protein kinase domain-containing protein n=1 Tax=Agaricus bisporus var. burnettii TaxID=192524 RepID=A0A8H7EYK0_AGABI|nr:hypothetical protein Agabi119p4_7976 [Agaricus bisporus var. burnettii]